MDIMASFNHYVQEKYREELKNLENDFWENEPEMHNKYLDIAEDIKIQKMDHEIDLYDLDENKFNQGKGGLGSIQNRQKELIRENKQYIKNLFLFEVKEAEKEVITVPANGKEDHEGLKLDMDEKLYKKYLSYERKVNRKKEQFRKAYDNPVFKNKSFENFLKERYPGEAKIFDEKDTAIMFGLDGIVKYKKYDLAALAEMPIKKGKFKDRSMNVPKGTVRNIVTDINNNRTINKRFKR